MVRDTLNYALQANSGLEQHYVTRGAALQADSIPHIHSSILVIPVIAGVPSSEVDGTPGVGSA